MNIKDAQKIVNDYGALLIKTTAIGFSLGIPESLLPYSKKGIKEAIIIAYKNTSNSNSLKQLIFGYNNLASFITDEEAKITFIAENLMAMGRASEIPIDLLDQHIAIQENIKQNTQLLRKEIEKE